MALLEYIIGKYGRYLVTKIWCNLFAFSMEILISPSTNSSTFACGEGNNGIVVVVATTGVFVLSALSFVATWLVAANGG